MNALMGWSLAGLAVAVAGGLAVFAWDCWQAKRADRRAAAVEATAPVPAEPTPVEAAEAAEPVATETPVDDHECTTCENPLATYLQQQPHITVDLPNGETFVLVLGDRPLDPEDLNATRKFLQLRYGPVNGTRFFFLVLDAYTAHEARDLDTELARLGENS